MNSSAKKPNAVLYTIAAAAVTCALIAAVFFFNVPNPNMILIAALVFFTGAFGLVPGLMSGILMILYSLFFFSDAHSFIRFERVNAEKMFVIVFGMILCYIVVAMLKYSRDHTHSELIKANKELKERAENAERITELQQAVSSLLTNMPAMTFSKSLETGKYLACNQMFAEYAHKNSPEEVVGLNDYEIFDKETAEHFLKDDRIAMGMDSPYVFVEDVLDAAGSQRHLQTTKLRFTDRTGKECVLGMSVDVTELVDARKETIETRQAYEKVRSESITYTRIAQALAKDYYALFYVDMRNDQFTEYHLVKGQHLTFVRKMDNFFEEARRDAETLIYAQDLNAFLARFSKENIVKELEEHNSFEMVYRQYTSDGPQYMSMKASRLDEGIDEVVIGVRNVDERIRQREKEEQLKEEQQSFARISALSGDYLAIYAVDPVTEQYSEFRAADNYSNLQIEKVGEDFFMRSRENGCQVIDPEDLDRYLATFTKENVLRTIEKDRVFSMQYRLILGGQPHWVMLRAALVTEDETQRLIVGVTDIDAQVRREEEYAQDLEAAQKGARIDGLTGVKNKRAFDEAIAEIKEKIEKNENPQFALLMFDVNNLKKTNDTFGHQTGDVYLKEACAVICSAFKHSPVFRVGGDEFAVIAEGQDYENAEELMNLVIQPDGHTGSAGPISIAGGMGTYRGEGTTESVFEEADQNMYENKRKMKVTR